MNEYNKEIHRLKEEWINESKLLQNKVKLYLVGNGHSVFSSAGGISAIRIIFNYRNDTTVISIKYNFECSGDCRFTVISTDLETRQTLLSKFSEEINTLNNKVPNIQQRISELRMLIELER